MSLPGPILTSSNRKLCVPGLTSSVYGRARSTIKTVSPAEAILSMIHLLTSAADLPSNPVAALPAKLEDGKCRQETKPFSKGTARLNTVPCSGVGAHEYCLARVYMHSIYYVNIYICM